MSAEDRSGIGSTRTELPVELSSDGVVAYNLEGAPFIFPGWFEVDMRSDNGGAKTIVPSVDHAMRLIVVIQHGIRNKPS